MLEIEKAGYAQGEKFYNNDHGATPIVDGDENDIDNNDDEHEPDDYDGGCTYDEFTCKNQKCIPQTQRCDGTRHCDDESDELGCNFNKSPGD